MLQGMPYTTNPFLPRVRMSAVLLVRKGTGVRQVAERIGVSPNWVTRRESKARVKPEDAARYLAGLATFGTVPVVEVKVA